jgi:hypothetical protein
MLSAPVGRYLQVFALATAILFATRPALCVDAIAGNGVRLTPESLSNGAPCLITVTLHDEASAVTGTWQGHPVLFFSSADHRTWFALAGVDVEVHPGSYPLNVDAIS